jgi:microcystin-dependent protein
MGTPYMSEIKLISFNFAPKGWAFCNGQFLPINQNQALFSLLGTTYGGNGQTTFALPDLRGRAAMHMGNGHTQGEAAGQYAHTLTLAEMPAHTHNLLANTTTAATANSATPTAGASLGQSIGVPKQGANFPVSIYSTHPANQVAMAPQSVTSIGGSQPHENRQPYLGLYFIIALVGAFPSRN